MRGNLIHGARTRATLDQAGAMRQPTFVHPAETIGGVDSLEGVFREETPALELRGLTKRYDDDTRALEDFDLRVRPARSSGCSGPTAPGRPP